MRDMVLFCIRAEAGKTWRANHLVGAGWDRLKLASRLVKTDGGLLRANTRNR